MWTRKELKENAKKRFKLNYWKSVLAALMLALVCGSCGAGTASGSSKGIWGEDDLWNEDDSGYEEYDKEYDEEKGEDLLQALELEEDIETEPAFLAISLILFLLLLVIVVVVLVMILPLQILVFNPLEVGLNRFFHRNLREQAQVKEICFSFDHEFKNCVKIQFFRGLYTFLWTLLLIIPGIIKSYEYQMIPYILGEHPDMEMDEVFALSKSMMYGNKWKAFVLDLSFLGWYILNGLTLGILGIFYLNPYVYQTQAGLYQALKEEKEKEQYRIEE